jgi:hypothetical protein
MTSDELHQLYGSEGHQEGLLAEFFKPEAMRAFLSKVGIVRGLPC